MIERKRFLILLPILLFCLFSIVETIENPPNGVLCIVAIIACNIFWGTAPNRDRKTFVYFNITFFTFLVGQLFFQWYDKSVILPDFTDDTLRQVYIYMAVSLVSIVGGVKFCELCEAVNGSAYVTCTESIYCDLDRQSSLLQVVRIAYSISFPCYVLTLLDQAAYVNSESYVDFYINYTSSIPYFFTKIGELNQILFALFICTEYRKEKLILPIGMFLFGSIISLGIGQRNIVVLNLVMLMTGLVFANQKSRRYLGKSLYTSKQVWIVVLMLPFFLSFLTFWGSFRHTRTIDDSAQNGLKEFFVSQGGQVTFFAYTIENKTKIWSQKVPYTFYGIYNYFRNLFGMLDYSMYSKRFALEGNSLSVTQFYIYSPISLKAGIGTGCCYLSELFYDWGLPGVAIGSVFLGWIIGKLRLDKARAPWKNAFVLIMIRWLVYIPRASYFEWVSRAFNIWNVTIVIMIYIAVNLIERKYVVRI